MPTFKVQFACLGPGDPSRNRYINTWHFTSPLGSAEDDGPTIVNCLFDNLYQPFYETWGGNAFLPGSTLKIYELGDPPESPPRYTFTWPSNPLVASPEGVALPTEVAACLSFEGVAGGIGPRARRRGRVYLGPLASDCIDPTPGQPMLSTAFMNAVTGYWQAMTTATAELEWIQGTWSRADDAFVPASTAWVDNAFDTQRRRGADPYARITVPFIAP